MKGEGALSRMTWVGRRGFQQNQPHAKNPKGHGEAFGPNLLGFELRNTRKCTKEQSCSDSLFASFGAFRSF